jgi:hypothetical protein
MISHISPDRICRVFPFHRHRKISIFLNFSKRQLLLKFWNFFKYLSCRNILQSPFHLSNRVTQWKAQEIIDRICCLHHQLKLKILIFWYFHKYWFRLPPYILHLNTFRIFQRPYQVLICVVNGLSIASGCYDVSYTTFLMASAQTFHPS